MTRREQSSSGPVYQSPELLERPYYFSVSMNRYIAAIIDTMNRGGSLEELTKPAARIRQMISLYQKEDQTGEPATRKE